MNIRERIANRTAPLVARWSKLPANMRGALWMLLAGTGFTGMTVCIKLAGQTMPIFVIIVLRAAFALVVISPAIVRAERGFFRTTRPGAHILRSVFGVLGISTMMLALTHLDLALATTLSFTRTLFMIVLAAVFLNEIIRWRRTAATVVGFFGVVICIQPGAAGFDPWTLVGVLAALFAGGVTTMVKKLTSTEPPLDYGVVLRLDLAFCPHSLHMDVANTYLNRTRLHRCHGCLFSLGAKLHGGELTRW